ncbi:PARP-domain-containing protein [Rickenella mellea]|uniref:Poly [ADP-ribose] polymerase n=1 Tax=Rickenella mellea TaxID=50990 RepID=A0A4Y7QMQ5_9AGAM|nr:PARP-domain-containing protein [Rickenella mellea]
MPPKRKAAAASAAATATASAPDVDGATSSSKPTSKKRKAPASKAKGKKKVSDVESDAEPSPKKPKLSDPQANRDDQEEDEQPESQKMVTILKRGAAPVDPLSSYVATHQVYANSEDVWDAMLNQTDLGKNANKFYVIQLLHPIGNGTSCLLYVRWGRVGENGASQTKGPFSSSQGVTEFKKQFRSKTATPWEQRKGMTAKKGKYYWLERSFEDEEGNINDETKPSEEGKGKGKEEVEKIPDSSLHPEVQSLCRLIFSTTFIDAALSEMNYDAKKLPLGKLAKSTILNGFAALKELSEVINNPTKAAEYGGLEQACVDLSGRYYSIIPHSFGRYRPTVINNMVLLKKELELVDALGDMEIAQKLISTSSIQTDENGRPINPMDAHFRSLGLSFMDPVDRCSKEFIALQTYARETHGATHSHYKVDVQNAFRVQRSHEIHAFDAAGYGSLGDGERLLLWHGSRSTNFAGILSQGLRIAPPEAPVTGYMFGKGVYFADMISKSAAYCHSHMSNNIGILLLCEVAAKPFYEQSNANYNAAEECKRNGKLTTKGVGRSQPVDWQDAGEALDNDDLKGVHMPKGPAQDVPITSGYLQYNEYIAYDPAQIRVRYLLMVGM